jgi:hypothetical protein
MKVTRTIAVFLALSLAVSAVGGCAPRRPTREPAPAPAPKQETETAAPEPSAPEPTTEPEPTQPLTQVNVRLYFIRGEKIGVAGRQVGVTSKATARAAIEALLAGPTATEKEFGLGTTIPAGTKLNGIAIADGTATVDLSKTFESGGGSLSMLLRVTQVVCTLTQFPSVKRVAFKLDGKPVSSIGGEGIIVSPPVDRADFEGQLPPILVETPVPGQKIASPVRIAGSSNVFEATHQINVTDPDGLIIAEKTVTATSGTGTRGTWSQLIAYPTVKRDGLGAIIVFEYSAKDGKPTNVVEIPVYMTK